MRCQSCGKEIADKAIICYRCGAPTVAPERPPAPAPTSGVDPRLTWGLLVALIFLLGALGLVTWREPTTTDWALLGGAFTVVEAGVWIGLRPRPPA